MHIYLTEVTAILGGPSRILRRKAVHVHSTDVARLNLDRKLFVYERVALRLHTFGCWSCRHLVRQMRTLKNAWQEVSNPSDAEQVPELQGLSESTTAAIKAKIARRLDEE